jgi:hypothetical protein
MAAQQNAPPLAATRRADRRSPQQVLCRKTLSVRGGPTRACASTIDPLRLRASAWRSFPQLFETAALRCQSPPFATVGGDRSLPAKLRCGVQPLPFADFENCYQCCRLLPLIPMNSSRDKYRSSTAKLGARARCRARPRAAVCRAPAARHPNAAAQQAWAPCIPIYGAGAAQHGRKRLPARQDCPKMNAQADKRSHLLPGFKASFIGSRSHASFYICGSTSPQR